MSDDLEARLRRVEDVLAIQRVVVLYGPAADAGSNELAASLWAEDGVYDWDAGGAPHEGRASVDRMLQSDRHRDLIGSGAAHFAGPPLVEVDGDRATALVYSLVMRRESEAGPERPRAQRREREGRYYLWRVSANRWDLERAGDTWQVRRRTNRLLDESGGGRRLFGDSIGSFFAEA